jgi:hypothetical protein
LEKDGLGLTFSKRFFKTKKLTTMKMKNFWFIKTASLLLLVAFMGSCKDENVEVLGKCPIVVSTNPANLATNVPLDQQIVATFNVAMNPTTLTQASFTIREEGNVPTQIVGTVTYSGLSATFTPSQNLSPGKLFTGTISRTAKDLKGNHLETDYVWTFTTVGPIPPTVISTDPLNLATNVPLDKNISATFSVAMNPATINSSTFILMDGTTLIPGVISYSGTTATLNPTNNLELGKTYTATITTGVANVVGTSLASNYVWTFSTGAAVAPTVISTDPANLATNVALDKNISATFSVPMNPATINSSSFTLKDGATTIPGTVSYSGTTATLNPTNNLVLGKTYTATITTSVTNVAGTSMASDYVWTFSTGAAVVPTVISTDPANLATNVALDKNISAMFSMPMNPATLTSSTFTLKE